MEDFRQLGQQRDALARINKFRIDTKRRQQVVALARKWIYEGRKVLTNAGVERLLRPTSLVPTEVGLSLSR
jgi:hypothetical protein